MDVVIEGLCHGGLACIGVVPGHRYLTAGLRAGRADGAGAAAALVDQVAIRLGVLPVQVAAKPVTRRRQIAALLGLRQLTWSWLVALVVMLSGAGLLDRLGRSGVSTAALSDGPQAVEWLAGGGSWLALVAPVLPVLGVGLAYGPGLDPAFELTAATPSGGLRLVLWRTVSVLLVAVPAALLVQATGLVGPLGAARFGDASPRLAAWLTPALVLTLATLALGSLVGLPRASWLVGAVWALGALLPVLAGAAPPLLVAVPDAAWLTAGLCSVLLVIGRRDRYAHVSIGATGGWA